MGSSFAEPVKYKMNIFKWYSARCVSSVFELFISGWLLLCSEAKIVDGKTCKVADLDRIFIATNVVTREERGPDLGRRHQGEPLTQWEFVEALICISCAKFVDTKQTKSGAEAMTLLIEKHLLPLRE